MSSKPRLDKAVRIARANLNLQQFGQSSDDWVWGGATACTHVVCQYLALLWTGKRYTLNQVNSMAGMPHNAKSSSGARRGMNNTELARFFKAAGLPYVIKFGLTFEQLLSYMNRGPVFYGMRYGSAPEWKNYHYSGVTSSPPYAMEGGKTQLTGFENGRHAVVGLGYLPVKNSAGTVVRYDLYRKEPNHHSPCRPERPAYDRITTSQGKREYLDYHDRLGNTLYSAIPTRSLTV
jgi:hypothetical protein